MNRLKLSDDELKKILKKEEDHFFDFKSKEITGQKLQKHAVAFANSDGGEIIVGIKDKKEATRWDDFDRWDGFNQIEDMNGLLQSLHELKPSPQFIYDALESPFDETVILRLYIEKSTQVCESADKTVYQRVGGQSLPLKDRSKIQQLAYSKGAASYEDELIKSVPPEIISESKEIRNFLLGHSPISDPLEFCVNQNLFDYQTWDPKVCATVLFHPDPSAVVPTRCAVKITRYETKEDEPEREHLAEQMIIEGPLNLQITKTVEAITQIMSNVKVLTPTGLSSLSYPPEAIWETVVNAVIHRDYSISDDTQILIFNNRIEIKSPGKLPGFVTVDNILDTRFSRNPKIVRSLARYEAPPNKDLGEGLNTTLQKMKEFGLQPPTFYEEGHYFIVSLPHRSLATPEEAVLTYLERNEKITNSQAREITGIRSENAMKQVFYSLRDLGKLEQVPELRGSKSAWRTTK